MDYIGILPSSTVCIVSLATIVRIIDCKNISLCRGLYCVELDSAHFLVEVNRVTNYKQFSDGLTQKTVFLISLAEKKQRTRVVRVVLGQLDLRARGKS